EGDRPLVLVDDRGGQLAGDDLAEDAVGVAHARKPIRIAGASPAEGGYRSVRACATACSRVAISPAYWASLSCASRAPTCGPVSMPSSRASSSPRTSGF